MKSLRPHSRAQLRTKQQERSHPQHRIACGLYNRRVLCSSAVADVLGPLQLQPQQLRQVEQACVAIQPERLRGNVNELTNNYLLKDVQRLLASTPQALALPVGDWRGFFEGYGLGKEAFWKALRYSSDKLVGADLYTAGAAIVWLKQLGPWSDADIANRLIPCYPEVLATSTEQLQQLVDTLTGLNMTEQQVQEMIWEFPGLLADFRQEQLPLIKRMVESRRDKYSQGGFYSD
ncbi:hypothetical protein COO60DRAFT_1625570 [Scenedesmus sp. NREL 46B-D3]|nr:hypothetical protein COO60DRAFT_1625570 [Scenedesmus sp. NREL 46B-D3]